MIGLFGCRYIAVLLLKKRHKTHQHQTMINVLLTLNQ